MQWACNGVPKRARIYEKQAIYLYKLGRWPVIIIPGNYLSEERSSSVFPLDVPGLLICSLMEVSDWMFFMR